MNQPKDLEFASVIVQKLNLILITSPEMADFRRRLKSLQNPVRTRLVTTNTDSHQHALV
jgi:hypothetical protein